LQKGNTHKIGIGTVQFGLNYGISNKKGKTNKIEIEQILNTAKSKGIKYIDTASAYGNAEEMLGQFDLSQFKVVSKFMPPQGQKISNQINQSLEKLNQNPIYGYLAHRPLDILENPEQWSQLQELKANGVVKKIGYSLNEPEEIYQLLGKGYYPDLIQVPYNYFDRRFEEIIIELKHKGCEIHTRSTFLQGLFFMKPGELSSFFDEVKPHLRSLQKINLLSKSLLNFTLNKGFIDKVIIGVENNKQLIENLDNTTEIKELEKLDFRFSKKILMPMYWPK
jgi:aryl-alcohol dehydrogenase-like predicted oxidoreductase